MNNINNPPAWTTFLLIILMAVIFALIVSGILLIEGEIVQRTLGSSVVW